MKKIFTPLLFLGNLIAILAIWWQHAAFDIISFGRLAGLLAYYLVLWQMLLIGRVGWIERVWGHDRLSRWHHRNGIVAWCLIAIHPILIIIGYKTLAGTGFVEQFLIFVRNYEDVLQALIAYIMFISIVAISLALVRKRLRYELWYGIHVLLYVAIILAFEHQLANGHDLATHWVAIYWQILFYGVFANVVWFRFTQPTINSWKQDFRVSRIERETHDVVSIYISSKNFHARAGQFIIVRFLAKGFWYESHPFTVSGTPLRITPKAVGDYTKKLPNLPIGTKVIIEGPLGKFTLDRAGNQPVLLIAGGIGITPLRVIFEEITLRGANAQLIYAARSDTDFALKDELDKIGPVTYTTERLSPEFIKATTPDVANRFVYLCGPPLMMEMVRGQLLELGVPKKAILYEKFQLG